MITYDTTSITEATQLQKKMSERLIIKPLDKPIKTIGGADISFNKYSTTVYAGIVIFSYPEMVMQSYSLITAETNFPYVSGYLAFREIPALMQAWEQLPQKPDLMILDGQGITHPRTMGIASHFGLLANLPSIGCAKSMLFGKFEELGIEKFSVSKIIGKSEKLGYALRTKRAVNPVYISPGHLIDTEDSLKVMKNCTGNYRIPEPTRMAHHIVNDFRTGKLQPGFHRLENDQMSLW